MSPASTAPSAPNLATCYQEILTVTARLRMRKFAVTDSASFRASINSRFVKSSSA